MAHNRKFMVSCLTAVFLFPLLLSAKSVKICVMCKMDNEPVWAYSVSIVNGIDKKEISVADTTGCVTLDVPDDGALLEFKSMGLKNTVINVVKDTTVWMDQDKESHAGPMWLINRWPVEVNYPPISDAPKDSLKHVAARALKILNEDEIKNVVVDKTDEAYPGNIIRQGTVRITARPCKIGIVVDGVLKKVVRHQNPAVLVNFWVRRLFASKKLKMNKSDIVSAVAVDAAEMPGLKVDADKFLVIRTNAQYRHLSETDYMPYQCNGVEDKDSYNIYNYERYRIVDKSGKIGYADPQGNVVIVPRYAFAFPFEYGKAKVTNIGQEKEVEINGIKFRYWDSDNWFYIDQWGNRIPYTRYYEP